MLFAGFWTALLNTVTIVTGIFMILLVLIQRGRGGGLVGALGGAGGSSPFGSRAGDTFTRITLVVAAFWIGLAMIQGCVLQKTRDTSPTTQKAASPEGQGGQDVPGPESE